MEQMFLLSAYKKIESFSFAFLSFFRIFATSITRLIMKKLLIIPDIPFSYSLAALLS